MKKTIAILTISMILLGTIGLALAQDKQFESLEDYKKAVEKANSPGFWAILFGTQAVVGSGSWKTCERTCSAFIFQGDCNPCSSGETSSNSVWNEDSMSSYPGWSSASSYCNDPFKGYNYYNKQSLCSIPKKKCSGGADQGDKKCSVGTPVVWECQSNGIWDIDEWCDYTCDDGECVGECVRDSDCGSDGSVGSEFCSGGDVFQKQREYDCSNFNCDYSEEDQLIDECSTDENCVGGECISSCQPKTCSQLNLACGLQDDGCGNEINCGSCSGNENCVQGICKDESCTPSCSGKTCGSDGCDGVCGTCDDGETCNSGICEDVAECSLNSDCKTLAEVVCDDETLWYKSYSCISGECNIGNEIPPESCVSEEETNFILQIAIGIIIVFIIGIIGFGIYKSRK